MNRVHRRIAAGALGAAAILTLGVAATAAAAQPASPVGNVLGEGAPGAIKDSYIVVFQPSASEAGQVPSAASRLAKQYGGSVRRSYASAVRGFSATLTPAAARRLATHPSVAYVEQDRLATIDTSQTNPPWGVDRIDQRALPLSKSYGYAGRTANVTAYILDTGIRTTHTDFGGRARNGYDFIDNDAVANDCNGHGTHVAGTVGGSRYGVAKEVSLVGVKVLNCSGSGSYSQIIAGVDWVTKNAVKPAVANMSLGGGASTALDDAVRRSIASGVTYALAGGNNNGDACAKSPARTPEAITVGATDSSDRRASFSNYGRCLDLFAPGVSILSAAYSSDTATATKNGTSMAAPHVAGAAAVFLAANPDASPARVRDALVTGATTGAVGNAGSNSPNRLLFTGVVNGPEPTPTPTASPTASPTVSPTSTPTASPTSSPTPGPECVASQPADLKTVALRQVTSSLTVTGCSGTASATSKVSVDIKHPNRGSLIVDLVGPDGRSLRLKDLSTDSGDNIDTTYTVNASGFPRNGTWKLWLWDLSSGNAGYLDAWTVRL